MLRILVLLSVLAAPAAIAKTKVDLELVLAVDISHSMDAEEQRIQRDGYVAALKHPAVLAAVGAGYHRRIAVTYVEWSGPWTIRQVLDWTLLATPEDAERASRLLARRPVNVAGETSISSVLVAAADMMDNNDFDGTRRVIDISGDGPNNVGPTVLSARANVLARGIEINGLPILVKKGGAGFQIDNLDFYYEDCVVGGPSAFVIPVYDVDKMAAAIRYKLYLEVAGLAPDRPVLHKASTRTDCMVGEKQRRDYMRSLGFQ